MVRIFVSSPVILYKSLRGLRMEKAGREREREDFANRAPTSPRVRSLPACDGIDGFRDADEHETIKRSISERSPACLR